MSVICIASPKGGVGKTMLTANLAYTLQQQGLNVTVIDFDSQDALKIHFGFSFSDGAGYVANAPHTAYWRDMVRQTNSGVKVLPYGKATREERRQFESFLTHEPMRLAQALNGLHGSRDEVLLIDLPPGHSVALDAVTQLNPIMVTVLMADSASLAVLPTVEEGAFYPVEMQNSTYFVINQIDFRSELSRDVYEMLTNRLGPSLLGTIHRDPAVSEAHALQISMLEHAYSSSVIKDLKGIAHNLMRLILEKPVLK